MRFCVRGEREVLQWACRLTKGAPPKVAGCDDQAFTPSVPRAGLAFIFISHKLHEVVDVTSRIIVLRNGRVAWEGAVSESSVDRLVELMGGDASAVHHRIERAPGVENEAVRVGAPFLDEGESLSLRRGEIVGRAGLEGHGQKDLLRAIYEAETGPPPRVSRNLPASFVSGDRRKEGVFPLWNVLANIAIGRIATRSAFRLVFDHKERLASAPAAERLRLDPNRFDSPILELSGGNQQKALVSRAVAAMTRSFSWTIRRAESTSPPSRTSIGCAASSRAKAARSSGTRRKTRNCSRATACSCSPMAGSCASSAGRRYRKRLSSPRPSRMSGRRDRS